MTLSRGLELGDEEKLIEDSKAGGKAQGLQSQLAEKLNRGER